MLQFFLQILPNLQFQLLQLGRRQTSHRGTVGSASACQARGHGFEPGLKRFIFIAENIPVLAGPWF